MNVKAFTYASLLAVLPIAGCTHWQPTSANVQNTAPIEIQKKLPTFNKLIITGPVHVALTQQGNPQMRIRGAQDAATNIMGEVHNNTLYIRSMRTVPAQEAVSPTVYIHSNALNEITYNGTGTLTASMLNTPALKVMVNSGQRINLSGKHIGLYNLTVIGPTPVTIKGIKSAQLDVHAQRASDISLDGEAGLRVLDFYGPGKFYLTWVNSPQVTVRSHQGHIFLAGITHSLDAEISRDAQLDTRYLRAKNAFVNTADNARLDVNARHSLNAFASGSSNIYFYQTPRLLTKYMRQKGSVLQIQETKPCTQMPCWLERDK